MATVLSAVSFSGLGLHSGAPCEVRVLPADQGAGLCVGPPGGPRVRLSAHSVETPGGQTRAVGPSVRVDTVEHLIAALWVAGVQDAELEVSGPELPALDGCAEGFYAGLRGAGLHGEPWGGLRVVRPVAVVGHGGWAGMWPSAGLSVAVDVDFGAGLAGRARWDGSQAGFERVARARTFVLSAAAEALRAAGRGGGATAENTVLWPAEPEALRMADEPVQHKLLDAIGDLGLLGEPLRGRVVVHHGSHALHVALLRLALRRQALRATTV